MGTGKKSHKGSVNRFKVSANGKLKRIKAGKKHLNSHKAAKRKMRLRRPVASTNAIAKRYVHILEG
jgi:ribosomal protein L35